MANNDLKHVRKVAVLGAGVMGAQIAAHCINAKIPVVLFDLAKKPDAKNNKLGDNNAIAKLAIANLQKLKPTPLAHKELAGLITPANYDDNLNLLADCDLVIEAIAERLDWKQDLYNKVAPAINPDAIFVSNTSGLSITELSAHLPNNLKNRFCGVHFFNPPRYMPLVELIPTIDTEPHILDFLESFLVTNLGKSVVRAKDTPNFVGNRIGVFGIISIFHHALANNLPFDLVDQLTGSLLGRAKSGTFRTADVVGLDTLAHVINTMREHLANDPFHPYFVILPVLSKLIEQGALGQKTGAGFFKKEGRNILRLDPESGSYVPADSHADAEVVAILREPDPAKRLQALHDSNNPQAKFVWSVLRDSFHYSAVHLANIADTARDIDQAMRWGFGHQFGPFEIWQAAGWQKIVKWINDDIKSGKTLSDAPLPEWVTTGPVWQNQAVHTAEGSFSPSADTYKQRSKLGVYQRQPLADLLVGEKSQEQLNIVHEDDAVRCWTVPSIDADVLVLSFKTKMHTISDAVVQGINQALDLAENEYKALVIGQTSDPFSAGADLKAMLPAYMQGGAEAIGTIQKQMQDMVLRLRYAQIPVVAAISGMALGGGCELSVYCARRVAYIESYIGLVEAGMGLVPGGGGLTYIARHAAEQQKYGANQAQLLAYLSKYILNIASAKVAASAYEAREMGFLLDSDPIVMNRHELLYVAIQEASNLAKQAWRPPVFASFAAAGRDAIATVQAQLLNLQVGGFISEHDQYVAKQIAFVACGGDVDAGSQIDELWLQKLERQAFADLLSQAKTQERINSFIQTGKPVRN